MERSAALRILDANANRAREALRVATVSVRRSTLWAFPPRPSWSLGTLRAMSALD